MNLEVLWYLVLIFSMIAYAVLDGFDLGVGALHLFTKKDQERRVFLNAIGPVWDGNEVWLVIVVGALFAGFPEVYATMFSAAYNLVILFLAALIFRVAAIEFRSKLSSAKWRRVWDWVFFGASVAIAFGVGLLLGNLVEGIPLNENRDFVGTFGGFFNRYSILVGITTLSLFMMHGAIYLVMKTEGTLHKTLRRWVHRTILFFVTCYLATTVATFAWMHHMMAIFKEKPWLILVPMAAVVAITSILFQIRKKRDGTAFVCSCVSIALLLSLFSIGTYPTIIRSSINPQEHSLFISNSASSPLTLKVLLIIVIIGVPPVMGYGYYLYRTFRGKVVMDKNSY